MDPQLQGIKLMLTEILQAIKLIPQAIKLAPRFLFQIYFQPSRLDDFIRINKKNASIHGWSTLFQGLILGMLLAVPHYLWYNNITLSLLFAGAGAVAGTFACAVAGTYLVTITFVIIFAGIIIFGLVTTLTIASVLGSVSIGTGIDALVSTGKAAYAGTGIITGTTLAGFHVGCIDKQKKSSKRDAISTILVNLILLLLIYAIAYGKGDIQIKGFEAIIPIAFLTGYIFALAMTSAKKRNDVKEKRNTSIIKSNDPVNPYYRKIQKFSLLWGPLFALIICFPIFYKGKPERFSFLIITAIGFYILPIFILHIPDYLLCLPVWRSQLKRILRNSDNQGKLLHFYDTALLFKHEMLYFPLPGLRKIISAMATNPQLGIKEAVKRLSYLYLFTFQQEEALAALNNLWQIKENRHRIIHYLLAEKNVALLEKLSENSRLAKLYLGLFEDEYQLQPDLPKKLDERLIRVRRDMLSEEECYLNTEMAHTLDVASNLIAAGSLKDIYAAVGVFERKTRLPDDLDYFITLQDTASQLIEIKSAFKKIEDIERYETKRAEMEKQKNQVVVMTETTVSALYEPFSTIWQKALINCAETIQKEIDLLHGSAVFDIQLINNEILTGSEKQTLHLDVSNKGQELGRDVSFTLHAQGAPLSVTVTEPQTLPFLESGQTKRIAFPVSVVHPGKAVIKLSLTFSDRTRENKQETFSFPVTITEKQTEFKKIENPYIAGPALHSDSPLFIGRDDIYKFIDENIIPSRQHHTIVCHGLRRTGKSSLLYYIENQGFTDNRLIPINIDLQGIANENDFYLTLSEKILQKLSPTSPPPVDDFGSFKRFLKEIAKSPAFNAGKVVLMLDEFEELQMRVEENRMDRTVFSNIRHLMQHQDTIIFLFCGTHKIEELKADYWSIFFNTALYRRIGSLPKQDAVRLITEPVKDQLNYDDLAVEHILTMTGGQPYLIQLICRTIINDLNKHKKRNDALVNDVDDAVEHIINEDNDNFSRETWKDAGHLERMILSAAAEELIQKRLEQVNMEDILDKIAPQIKDFSREEAVDTLDKLVTGEILVEKNLNYRFNIDMMRQWIATRHPLRKVRG